MPEVSCEAIATQNSSEWPCSMRPFPQLRMVGVRISYIFFPLIFPEHLELWTPLQIPSWGPPLGCTLLQSLLSDLQPLYNHIEGNGQRSRLLVTTSGWTWTWSYLTLGQGCPERGVQHGGSPSWKGKDLTEYRSVGCRCEVAGSVSKGWHYWTAGILVVFWR